LSNVHIELIDSYEGRTPLIFIEVQSTLEKYDAGTILVYGHLDKQPPLDGWREGLGPYNPVIVDGKLYGRGGSDDGYAIFSAITSILTLHKFGLPHGRIVIIIEASEESGSPDLPFYVNELSNKLGNIDLVICLDSGCGNYDQLWLTTSLRGMIVGNLRVDVLKEGAHSGKASGIIPDSFRIARQLLDRLEDPYSGKIIPKDFYVELGEDIIEQQRSCSLSLGEEVFNEFSRHEGLQPVDNDITELLLNRCWRPQLTITGVEGIPSLEKGGNVLRSYTTLKLSLRIPPKLYGPKAAAKLKQLLEENPPYNSKVSLSVEKQGTGWASPTLKPWLRETVFGSSNLYFGKPPNFLGEGGSIPFMGMLGEKYPNAQFVVTGVLGPESNAHGPNEMLDIGMAKKITACVTTIIFEHFHKLNKTQSLTWGRTLLEICQLHIGVI